MVSCRICCFVYNHKKGKKIQRSDFPHIRSLVRRRESRCRGLQNGQPLYYGNNNQSFPGAFRRFGCCLPCYLDLLVKFKKHPKPIDGIDYFLEDELKKQAEEKETVKENSAEVNNEQDNKR